MHSRTIRYLLVILAISLSLITFPTVLIAQSNMPVIAFGDCLLDSGNAHLLTTLMGQNPAVPPSEEPYRRYWEGRFSNGPNVGDYLAENLCAAEPGEYLKPILATTSAADENCISFAFGGGATGYFNQTPGEFTVPGLLSQVLMYKLTLRKNPALVNGLHVIWVGSADYLFLETPASPKRVIRNISRGIRKLYRLGARKFMVLNLPDLGLEPFLRDNPEAAAQASALTKVHNRLLAAALSRLGKLPDIHITEVDIYDMTNGIIADPLSFGFDPSVPPVAAGCLFALPANPDACLSVGNDNYFGPGPFPDNQFRGIFWDEIHPATNAHWRLSQSILDLLAGP
jgi:phospholipase/lecithinase/hemolysin